LQRTGRRRADGHRARGFHHRGHHPRRARHAPPRGRPHAGLDMGRRRRVRKLKDVQGTSGSYRVGGIEITDSALAEAMDSGLDRVEALLRDEVRSGYEFVVETSLHLIEAGGKRFRPLFTLLAGQIGPRAGSPQVVTAATVVELVHLATLYH